MNKRDYKKAIEALGTGMCVEIFNIGVTEKQADTEKIQQAISIAWNAMESAKHGANIFFDKSEREFENRQAYRQAKNLFFKNLFAKLNADFESQIDEALKLVNHAVPKKA